MKYANWMIALFVLIAGTAQAGKIRVRLPDTTVVRGSVLSVPVYADSSFTGMNVTSFQLRVQFSSTILRADSVLAQGTIISGLGSMSFHASGGIVTVAWAGTTPLQGTGVLAYLRFQTLQAGYTNLSFPDTLTNFFNENTGQPGLVTRNGSVSVQDPPSITVSPATALLAVGETIQFSATGGTPPYTWSVTNPAAASISPSGLLTAVAQGRTRVEVMDSVGNADTSSGETEVRPMRLTVQNVSGYATTDILVPINTTSIDGLEITSGVVSMTFPSSVLRPLGVELAGTLLDGYGTTSVDTSREGILRFAFAGTTPIGGSGTLLMMRLRIESSAYSTTLTLAEAMFNETMPAKRVNGNFTLLSAGTPSISPGITWMFADDSVQFSVSGGLPPYEWSTSDSSVAMVDDTGLLRGARSGIVRVTVRDSLGTIGTTNNITVYGASVALPTRSAGRGVVINVPIGLERLVLSGGEPVVAISATIVHDTSRLLFRGIQSSGTLTDGWTFAVDSSENRVAIAGATTSGFSSTGTILLLRYETRSDVSFGATGSLTLQSVVLNEGDPTVRMTNGRIDIVAPPAAPVLYGPTKDRIDVSTQPTLSWSSPSGSERFRLQVATDSLFSSLVRHDSTLSSSSNQVGPLTILTTYYWRVAAVNGAGESPWSAVWSFTTMGMLPSAAIPAEPADSALMTGDSATVRWFRAFPDVSSYDVEWSSDSSFSTSTVDSLIADTSAVLRQLTPGTFWWRVRARNAAGIGAYGPARRFIITSITTVGETDVPEGFVLLQNFPNPFNPATSISYKLAVRSTVDLIVFNTLGQTVASLVHGEQEAGWHRILWNAGVPSGVYYYRLRAVGANRPEEQFIGMGRMVLLR